MQRDVLLAVVLGAHGLKGEVRVKAFTAEPEKLGAYGPLHAKDGRLFTVEALKSAKDSEVVAAFAEVCDRNGAEALKGVELYVKRGSFPEADDGEYYHTDLVGLDAEDGSGRRIGKVLAVQNYGAGDVLVIATDTGDEILIAFTRDNIPEIDVKAGRVVVVVPDEVEAQPARDME